MTITDPEFVDATLNVEHLYRDELQRLPELTFVDALGRSRWATDYYTLRRDGQSHDAAKREVRRRIRQVAGLPDNEPPPPPPPPPPFDLIEGQLRREGPALKDAEGFVLPTFCHFGEAFSRFVRHPDAVLRQLDVIVSAGYHGIRFWDTLGFYHQGWLEREVTPIAFRNDRGDLIAPTPQYYEQLRDFLNAVKARQLVVHHSRGDLNSWPKPEILAHCRRVGEVQRTVGLPVIGLNEAVNESNMNIADYSDTFLREMLAAIGNPAALGALSTPPGQGEETADIIRYMKDVWYVHGFRGGDENPVGQVRHIFSLRYDGPGKETNHPGWQGETAGRGMYGPDLTRPDTLALCTIQALAARQAWTYSAKRGVFFDGPIEEEPGFFEVPKVRQWLPDDLFIWPEAFHGGDTWASRRVFRANLPDGTIRCDHRLDGTRLFMTLYAKPGRRWDVPVDRACRVLVIDPLHGPADSEQTFHPGQTFVFDGRNRTGIALVGSLL